MKSLALMLVVGCSSPPPRPLVRTPEPVESAAPAGSLIWVKPVAPFEYTGVAPPEPTRSNDPDRFDRLMVFDFATGTSRDLREALTRNPGVVTPAGDAAYLIDKVTQRVSQQPDGWHADILYGLASTDDTVVAIAPDESSVLTLGHDGFCLVMAGTQDCTRIELPFPALTATYTSGGRVIVTSVPIGKYDVNAVGHGRRVEVAVIDLATKQASRIDVAAVDAIVSTDGRLAWIEQAADKLVLSVAVLDHLKTKQTFTLGPAAGQADADCAFAGERILCVVEPASALVSLARKATMVTLESAKVVSRVFPSPDGRWVVYARDDGDKASWLVTPTDRSAPQPLPLDAAAEPSAWLR